jgi:hypothetical protein
MLHRLEPAQRTLCVAIPNPSGASVSHHQRALVRRRWLYLAANEENSAGRRGILEEIDVLREAVKSLFVGDVEHDNGGV